MAKVQELKQDKVDNVAYVDGQNLHMATKYNSWKLDLERFRIYLRDKYKVKHAYYFLGFLKEENNYIYEDIQKAGFVLVFKEHNSVMMGNKKGNVDSDIIFSIMNKIYYKEKFGKIVIVSGDGDYKKVVDFLIKENRFEKILFPANKNASSLYKKLGAEKYDYLENIKSYINKKGS